ncbi:hypothetical protein HZQ75_15360 [Elizabethkingia anophelis]|uniref:Uncharacterized protein n=2 Tax=Weeksellaceae TaxID=2762318 RepID=A0ABN5BQP6_9FLAO|nr:hypothetical protein BAZ09_008620 [Elizabethkingia anophelis R26]ATC39950.1 hypothetical protein EAAG1_008835 [Elizabethkingia anophelis Ag1]ATC43628.1 hypothetical protein CMV41_08835 [Elizabethkingia anophelis]ATC47304.1 hypothetical protein CMV40_08835 [Elizabethkingia anophelis]ELR80173.1 hypothetical protein D505_05639 [Elizabethkingia anophelis R26]
MAEYLLQNARKTCLVLEDYAVVQATFAEIQEDICAFKISDMKDKLLNPLKRIALKEIIGGKLDPIPGYPVCMLIADDDGNILDDKVCPARTCCNSNNECVPLRLNQC